jgi:tRNA/tmRNA/rRNA uracil-C5-methylase (TrmA/RlmC/RlmD family)
MDVSSKIKYNSPMKFGDLTSGTITRFDDEGRGVFDILNGAGAKRPFSVPFTTIGDEVKATCIRRMKGRYIGRLEQMTAAGPSRDSDAKGLPFAPWMHIRYEDQLTFKRDLINRSFENAGHEERVDSVIPCPKTLLYRNRMDYCFGWKGEIGMKELGAWNRYIDLDDCPLMEGASDVLRVFHEFNHQFPDLKPWDAKRHDGDLRYVLVRRGMNTGDQIIALVVKDLTRITEEMRAWLVSHLDPIATSICLSENPLITDLSLGTTIVPLKGKETFDEIINGTRFTIHLNSFFQTNSTMAAVLQDTVWDLAIGSRLSAIGHSSDPAKSQKPKAKSLLDLYCGLGFFGINFAQRDPNLHVSGFEIDEHAIALAKTCAEQNAVADRCDFTSGKAEDLSWKEIDADVCIVDPPRSGLHPRVIEKLIERRYPRLVYVSCKYQRLVEELKTLKAAYEVKEIRALDLFPHTPHVEVVVMLERKGESPLSS